MGKNLPKGHRKSTTSEPTIVHQLSEEVNPAGLVVEIPPDGSEVCESEGL